MRALLSKIATKSNPTNALYKLAKSAGVEINRLSDPCQIIVDCLTDYGASTEERGANRQFAARDARALRYVVREKMNPKDVLHPAKGERVSEWANREAAYRASLGLTLRLRQKGVAVEGVAAPPKGQLASISLNRSHDSTSQ
jgi:hypothetical protein